MNTEMKIVLCSALLFIATVTSQTYSHVLFVTDPDYSPGGTIEGTGGSEREGTILTNDQKNISSGLGFGSSGKSENVITCFQQTSFTRPGGYYLGQKAPSTLDPETEIYFSIPGQQHVRLVILDMLGQEKEILINETVNAGTYKISIDGSEFASGIYVCRLESEVFSDSRKLLLIK